MATIRETFTSGITKIVAQPASQPGDVFPAGIIMAYGGSSAPTDWLLCDGTAVSRATYSNLFTAIGTTFGAGDGSSTFNLPDLRSRVPMGKSASYALGSTGGEATHTLTTTEMPAHTHSVSGSGSGATDTQGNHAHLTRNGSGFMSNAQGGDTASYNWGTAGTTAFSDSSTNTTGAHAHNVSVTISGTAASAGSGAAHNNLQPYLALNYIIKT